MKILQNHIIHHVDNDGYGSAIVVKQFFRANNIFTPVVSFKYNYNNDTTEIEQSLENSRGLIYIVDVTLPDELMLKYADRICWIDHHKHVIDNLNNKPWNDKLSANMSKTHMTNEQLKKIALRVHDGKIPSHQVSACELAWLSLFPEEDIPLWVFLIGRYDIWDHHNDATILNFKAGIGELIVELEQLYPGTCTDEILISLERSITKPSSVIKIGKTISEAKQMIYKQQAIRSVTKHVLLGKYKIMMANTPVFTSLFFDSVVTPDVEVLVVFNYNATQNQWALSCYGNSLNKDRVVALDVLTALNRENGCAFGGHADACGITLTDIKTQFLDYLTPLE